MEQDKIVALAELIIPLVAIAIFPVLWFGGGVTAVIDILVSLGIGAVYGVGICVILYLLRSYLGD